MMIKRYKVNGRYDDGEDPKGEWCKYSDIEAILIEIERRSKTMEDDIRSAKHRLELAMRTIQAKNDYIEYLNHGEVK
jgi:hypothetical protein